MQGRRYEEPVPGEVFYSSIERLLESVLVLNASENLYIRKAIASFLSC